jgi:hypothetical protein
MLYDLKMLNEHELQKLLLLETKKLLAGIESDIPYNTLLEIRLELTSIIQEVEKRKILH